MAGFGRLRHLLHRAVFGRGVVLGDDDQRGGQCQADHGAPEQGHAEVGREHFLGDEVERTGREHAGDDQAAVQRIHDLAAFANAHEEGADDGGDDGNRAQHQRIDRARPAVGAVGDARDQHRGDDGDRVGFEQIRCHARAVADVVAHVVGDDGRVAWVIFGDAGFDLAHQVGADVGALGEDAAAETREDRDQRTTEGQADHRLQRGVQRFLAGAGAAEHVHEVTGDAQQAQAHHQHAGDRAALEADVQRGIQAQRRRLRGTHVGAHRDEHADEAGSAGQDRADRETDRGRPAIGQQEADEEEQDDADQADRLVLATQVGAGAFLDGRGDLLHFFVAGRLGHDPARRNQPVNDGEGRTGQRQL